MAIKSSQSNHYFGWKRDLPDARDYMLLDHESLLPAAALPSSVDMRSQCPPIYDQGNLGSCTANSIAAGVQFLQMKQQIPNFIPSRLFIYYQERLDQGDVANDTGASIRESAKAVATYGVPPETDWPYDISKFAEKPPGVAYTDAEQTKVTQYLAVAQSAQQMKSCLANGYPIHIGFSVYSSFESQAVAQSGAVPMPDLAHEQLLGGHAVTVVGYDDGPQTWLCRNSWGTGWGMAGYFTFPYAYLTSARLSGDFWTLRKVTGPTPGPTPTPTPTPTPGPTKLHQIDVYSDGSYQIVM
ncbi:MAG TPA: C1 family peptidase [Dehalococcoidia bacterium]|nr:C1 family peptidase [Dehalococcoidia bacterium]